jgi:hypothetical protein
MCSRPPTTDDGKQFACRSCNECIATRRHGWVGRAMAEKATSEHMLAFTLTYDDDTPENRDSAAMFNYFDVRLWLARVRDAIKRAEKPGSVRFIVAGEQGERNGRCHWHVILYSYTDLLQLGSYSRFGKPVTGAQNMLTVGSKKVRLHWDLWGRGFVTVQAGDEASAHYCLSYALKDQFSNEKSRETMREAHGENFATGLFRPSKRPPIGAVWLWSKLDRLQAMGAVLPSIQLSIPGFAGYYVPQGSYRTELLWGLRGINDWCRMTTGVDAPQWSSLLQSLAENPPDLEILSDVKEEHSTQDGFDTDEARFAFRSREAAANKRRGEIVRRCGGQLACSDCLHLLDFESLKACGVEIYDLDGQDALRSAPGYDPVPDRQQARGKGCNPYCRSRGSRELRLTFPGSGQAPA